LVESLIGYASGSLTFFFWLLIGVTGVTVTGLSAFVPNPLLSATIVRPTSTRKPVAPKIMINQVNVDSELDSSVVSTGLSSSVLM